MLDVRKKVDDSNKREAGQTEGRIRSSLTAPPAISLPKGGGAIRGMGEKFTANPVTGTGSMSVPIATSPGRSGFGPQLSLAYDSGAGNGPFGFGWSLSLPSITRKTDKGLPKYQDADASDTFILSGAEDLVPLLMQNAPNDWAPEAEPARTVNHTTYHIERYRPRIEGLFARIERWTNQIDHKDSFWRSISKDNVTTWYGKTAESRVADPNDETKIFSWLICESYDDKGNVVVYRYKSEDSQGIDDSQAHERNREDVTRDANRYLKRIRYANHTPYLPKLSETEPWPAPPDTRGSWFFEILFDYGEHYPDTGPIQLSSVFVEDNRRPWAVRQDPFSSYRAGFEVRSYRRCQRVLMFHHFREELGVDDYLVRAIHFTVAEDPASSFITAITQSGYVLQTDEETYLEKSLPALEFQYSKAQIDETVREVSEESLENLPCGLDGSRYQWVDLNGEGLSGVLTEQGGAWFYKSNLSALPVAGSDGTPTVAARFAPVERLQTMPSPANLSGGQQFLDLAGDGKLDVVQFDGAVPGFFGRTTGEGWETFRSFESLPNVGWKDPNLKFVDLTGDGHADILVTEDEVLTWYPSLGEEGFGPVEKVRQSLDEETGPRLLFADGTQSIYLSDFSGDGLTDLVRIRNGEVCYWPNLGYGRFGSKVTMDNSPWFDTPDQFDQKRIRLADIDGSGVVDIIYLAAEGVRLYFNQSGNRFSDARLLSKFPTIDNLSSVQVADLLGNGTACLVWSSQLPDDARQPMRYIDLMGGQKPHLLIKTVNNLGAETKIVYAPSTKFYLADKAAGTPWITKIPFPVHAVERVEIYDRISRNHFVTRYAYHHGYFDGGEREFRGFGMVEQWDTEEFAVLRAVSSTPNANIDEASHIPPVLTMTWFHTGAYIEGERISRQFEKEYYREPGLTDEPAHAMLLGDTKLPDDVEGAQEEEAVRALKGSMLRQEIYALDGTNKEKHPYTVTEQNFAIRQLQPKSGNRHAVFFTHALEAINYHYERSPADPRISHALTLHVDQFGNVLKSAAIGYGRRRRIRGPDGLGGIHDIPNPNLNQLELPDQAKQTALVVTYTENGFTNAILADDDYRAPLRCEARTYELTGYSPSRVAGRFRISDLVQSDSSGHVTHIFDSEIRYEEDPGNGKQRRLVEHVLTLYRRNDLSGSLPLEEVESLALPFESYKMAFTPELVTHVYRDRVTDPMLSDEGKFVHRVGDANWWIPSGQIFYSGDAHDTSARERTEAVQHFFLSRRLRDPFGHDTTVTYDSHDLLVLATRDPLNNQISADNDYRVLQPSLVTDPNGNRSQVIFDVLGMVTGTAVMGKASETKGDLLPSEFNPDPTPTEIDNFFKHPCITAADLLGGATTRVIYDLGRYRLTASSQNPEPAFAATIVRETHVSDLDPDVQSKVQISFTYSDGYGREIQKKIQSEPGPLVERGPTLARRWVGSGWTIFNNKGKPVRQYEPFFTAAHQFEFAVIVGVSPIVFYDPAGRAVGTLHPNHTYDKVVFDPWRQETWDVNDTLLQPDPKNDRDVGAFFRLLPDADYLPGWYAHRQGGALGRPEQDAARAAAAHAGTPAVAHVDSLGRTFLTIADNGTAEDGTRRLYATRVALDIEGNQRSIIDPLSKRVMKYDYDMLGTKIHQISMDAGARWVLNNVAGKPIHAWDSRNHLTTTTYDELQRSTQLFVREGSGPGKLAERTVYGEPVRHSVAADAEAQRLNLRGKVHLHYDGAGLTTHEHYDFKGNLLHSTRRFADEYREELNWSASLPPALGVPYESSSTYNALNRAITLTTPDHSVIRPAYNEANLLESVSVNLRGARTETIFVSDIDYDAKGQRTLIEYPINDEDPTRVVRTQYNYDPRTFRLTHLTTTRTTDGRVLQDLQDLSYTYDPVGNISEIRDDAQQTVYFRNSIVEPSASYEYDALYRLTSASGREHLGQNASGRLNPPQQGNHDDSFRTNLLHPGDRNAMGIYTERYEYDAVGNILRMIHEAGAAGSWTRRYSYNETSLIEPERKNNRLSRTSLPGDREETYSAQYTHDEHGNMKSMPHLPMLTPELPAMEWDFKDQLHQVRTQRVIDGVSGETVYYVYDAAGQRARKVIERPGGSIKEERIYLGGFEVYREHGSGRVTLQRETLHIMDDQRRIALVETKTINAGARLSTPVPLIRYQLSNHLGSSSLELDRAGEIISYEEYFPYGSTSYQAVRSGVEVSPKRYRYTGKERDEETRLYYHGARYYAPWLGRWISADPVGIKAGINLYEYAHGNPITFVDPSGNDPIPGNRILYPSAAEPHPAFDAAMIPQNTGPQIQGLQRYVISNVTTTSEAGHQLSTHRTLFFTNEQVGRMNAGGRVSLQEIPVDIITQFDRTTGEMLGTGDTALTARVSRSLRGSGIAGRERGVHFRNEVSLTGRMPTGFRIDVRHPRTVDNMRSGLRRFLDTTIGRSTQESSAAVGLRPGAIRATTTPTALRGVTPSVNVSGRLVPAAIEPVQVPAQFGNVGGPGGQGPGAASRALAMTQEVGGQVIRGLAFLGTLAGADKEARQVRDMYHGSVAWEAVGAVQASITLVFCIAAGVVDDAIFALTLPGGAVPVINSWNLYGSGPAQHVVGSSIRWLLSQ
jgi:RHS repeat-associated protein